ncbi:minor tail protein [Microbacterium phage Honk]|uniref:Minor tail protein n=1 Tax=Microbacterium phage Honk TaxID=2836095 RepID=A0A8F3E5J0_9CAUD|nr:minor tail protein [Microbacterium phage Honk]
MTEGWGALNGSGNQQVYINVYREGQDWGGNFSRYRIQVVYKGNGWGSYTGYTQYWSASTSLGHAWSGTFTIPSSNSGDIWLLNTTFDVGADGNGYGPGFNSSASIDTNHTSIGDGSVTVSEGAPPRIPKRPSTPGNPTFSEATPTSVRVSWTGSTDDRGAAVDAYLLRRRDTVNGPYTDVSQQNNTSRVVTGLTPNQTYVWSVYAHNGAVDNGGYSDQTAQVSYTQPGPPEAPAAPTLSAVGPDRFTVSWTAPDNNGLTITSYEVQWATDSGFTAGTGSASDSASPYVLTGRSPSTKYWVRVRATNSAGTSAWSSSASTTTLSALYFIDPATNVAEPVVLHYWNGSTYEPVQVLIDPELDGTFVTAG